MATCQLFQLARTKAKLFCHREKSRQGSIEKEEVMIQFEAGSLTCVYICSVCLYCVCV